ncbi:MAG: hypothetical protein ACYDAH_19440 [Steroidobacteraceae bacterium]
MTWRGMESPARTPRFIVLWDLQWRIIDHQRIEPHADLRLAMASTLQQLSSEGWQAEGDALYGFVFIRRLGERRMLMLTPRDPFAVSQQSFDPFKSSSQDP